MFKGLRILESHPALLSVKSCGAARIVPRILQPLGLQIDSLMTVPDATLNVVDRVNSFELMAVMVAPGYGIGFATRSRIACSRKLEIVMRLLTNGPHKVTTYLALPPHL